MNCIRYRSSVRGIHLNSLVASTKTPAAIAEQILLRAFPNHLDDGQLPACLGLESGTLKRKLQEFRYNRMQANMRILPLYRPRGGGKLYDPKNGAADNFEKMRNGLETRKLRPLMASSRPRSNPEGEPRLCLAVSVKHRVQKMYSRILYSSRPKRYRGSHSRGEIHGI